MKVVRLVIVKIAVLLALITVTSAVSVSAQTPVLASVNQDGSNLCNNGVYLPRLSYNGRIVIFHSRCSNVIPGVAGNGRINAYARDIVTGVTSLINPNYLNSGVSNDYANAMDVSADGRYVLFVSWATDIAAPGGLMTGYWVRDVIAGTTIPVGIAGDTGAYPGTISGDGSVVVLVTTKNAGNTSEVYAWNRVTGITTKVSAGPRPGRRIIQRARNPSVSFDGRYVFFLSDADGLVPEDVNGKPDVFVRDLATGVLRLVTVDVAGTASGNGDSYLRYATWYTPNHDTITPDGRYVAFSSDATNLVPNQNSGDSGIFVRDLVANTTISIPRAPTINGKTVFGGEPHITPDGRFVLFHSLKVEPDNHFNPTEVCLYDRVSGTTQVVSPPPPFPNFTNPGYAPIGLSPDGRYVTFALASLYSLWSNAAYTRDMQTGVITTVYNSGQILNDTRDVVLVAPQTGAMLFSTQQSLVPQDQNQSTDAYVVVPGSGSAGDTLGLPRQPTKLR